MIRRFIALAVAGLLLAGCAGGMISLSGDRSILVGGTSLSAKVDPIDNNTMARVEVAYGFAVRAALSYRRLARCAAGQSFTLARPCSDRSVIVVLQDANRKARVALLAARSVHASGGISAFDAIRLAREAVSAFQVTLSQSGIQPTPAGVATL